MEYEPYFEILVYKSIATLFLVLFTLFVVFFIVYTVVSYFSHFLVGVVCIHCYCPLMLTLAVLKHAKMLNFTIVFVFNIIYYMLILKKHNNELFLKRSFFKQKLSNETIVLLKLVRKTLM